MILDGQQRLTSLYQAFYGKGEHRYYLNLAGLEKGKDLEDCAFYMKAEDGEKEYGTIGQQAQALVFPMERVFGTAGGFSGWQNQVLRIRGGEAAEIFDSQERLTKLHTRFPLGQKGVFLVAEFKRGAASILDIKMTRRAISPKPRRDERKMST